MLSIKGHTHTYKKCSQEFGFYDVFLISDTGDVVYSVFKEIDFGTSLTTGPFKDSGLAKAFTNSLNNDGVSFTDFSLYIAIVSSTSWLFVGSCL